MRWLQKDQLGLQNAIEFGALVLILRAEFDTEVHQIK